MLFNLKIFYFFLNMSKIYNERIFETGKQKVKKQEEQINEKIKIIETIFGSGSKGVSNYMDVFHQEEVQVVDHGGSSLGGDVANNGQAFMLVQWTLPSNSSTGELDKTALRFNDKNIL